MTAPAQHLTDWLADYHHATDELERIATRVPVSPMAARRMEEHRVRLLRSLVRLLEERPL